MYRVVAVVTTVFLLSSVWMLSPPDFGDGTVIQKGNLSLHLEPGSQLTGENGDRLEAYGSTYPKNESHQVRLATGWSRAGVYYTCLHELQHTEISGENISYSEEHSLIGVAPDYDSRCNFLLSRSPF